MQMKQMVILVNTNCKMITSLNGFNRILETVEERVRKLEDRSIEMIKPKNQRQIFVINQQSLKSVSQYQES